MFSSTVDGYNSLRMGYTFALAGLGAATLYGANSALAMKVGAIYGFILGMSLNLPHGSNEDLFKKYVVLLSIDCIAIIACRLLGLIGNYGFAQLALYLSMETFSRNFLNPKKTNLKLL